MHMLTMPVVAILLGLASQVAHAQDIDTFSFSGSMFDQQGTLQLHHPHIGSAGSYYAGLGLAYADKPLVQQWQSDGHEDVIVGSQLSTRLQAGYNLKGKVRFDLTVPVYPSVQVRDVSTFAMGDIQLSATLPLLSYEDEGVGFAAVPFIDLPSGSPSAYLSSGGVGGGLFAALGGQAGVFGWNGDVGVNLARTVALDDNLSLGSALFGGLGFHVNVAKEFLVGAEGTSKVTFAGGFGPWNKQDVEAHAYASHIGQSGLVLTLGGGSGILSGVGAPDYRVLFAVAYHTPAGPGDRDGDGIKDDVDACPDDPEDFDQFEDTDGCPELDNDKDTILDAVDHCPNDPEDFDQYEDADGCPDPDNDKDKILDADDACPLDPGPTRTHGCPDRDGDGLIDKVDQCPDQPGPPETQGCPDTDGDLVPDFRDKCPNQPMDRRADPAHSDGCPARVVVTKSQIMILEKIYFDFNKATIRKESFPLLAEVAQTINDNPQIKTLEVAGHTDNKGNDAYNLKLSQARVEAVVQHLVKFGSVDASRLVPVGYGESKPIDTNDTEEGRQMNRRVEFNILKQEE